MNTVVETFIIEETSELIHDIEQLQKWNEMVEELGLSGQKTVVKTDKSPIPFLWMNSSLISTFETLCPTKVLVEKYSQTPIPVEILELVSLSRKEGYFDMIEIWYNETDKDPVCVGYSVDEEYKYKVDEFYRRHYSKKYLIGRWADVKASLDSLTKKARELFISNTTATLKNEIKSKQREIEDVEHNANRRFGGAMPETSFNF